MKHIKINTRVYTEENLSSNSTIQVKDNQHHYLKNVLRLSVGHSIKLFNGKDGEWLGNIVEHKKNHSLIAIKTQLKEQDILPESWLYFAPVKRTPIDYIASKATELGITNIQPILTDFTVVHRVNCERLKSNAIEAAELSERLSVPNIHPPIKLEKLLSIDQIKKQTILFADESGSGEMISHFFEKNTKMAKDKKTIWSFIIGPEGGFSDDERSYLSNQENIFPISLGSRVLKADTAVIATLAYWMLFCHKKEL